MNKSVAHYISELLFLHDCVIVPEFGGFVGNKKSAQLNKTTGTLTPPSKQILFNENPCLRYIYKVIEQTICKNS